MLAAMGNCLDCLSPGSSADDRGPDPVGVSERQNRTANNRERFRTSMQNRRDHVQVATNAMIRNC